MICKKVFALIVPAFMHCSILTTGAAADSNQHPKFGDYQAKGFLSDYSNLKLRAGTEDTFVFQDPKTDISQYNKLMVERIKVWFKEDAEYKGIDPAEIKDLTDYFHKAIIEAVGDQYPIVREPGPDVLRLRIAMTDLVPNKPSASLITLVVPFLWVAEAGSGVAKGDTGSTPFVGEVTIELEALDSQSNLQIAAFIERKIGLKYHWNKGVATAVSDYTKAYSTWAYTKQAMDHWAQAIRDHLDKAHGIVPAKN
jgi:hypothetical protein